MPLKFAANISMLFQEIPTLVGRFKAAKEAGFRFTECTFPYNEGSEELGEACKEAGLQHVLINNWSGMKLIKFVCIHIKSQVKT
jgi:hydroxypyruvate isomerase